MRSMEAGTIPRRDARKEDAMNRRIVVFLLPVLLLGLTGSWSGCRKKGRDCKASCQKMKKCSDEIAKVMAKKMGLPEAQAKGAIERMKKQFDDVDDCVKTCEKGTKGKYKDREKEVMACLAKSSCSAVAECYVNAAMP